MTNEETATWDYGEPQPRITTTAGDMAVWPHRWDGSRRIYQGWEVHSASLGMIFPTEEKARAERLRVSNMRSADFPGGFVEAFSRLAVEPVEWVQ